MKATIDYLYASFKCHQHPYRIRFKVIQISRLQKFRIVFAGTILNIGRGVRARLNVIYVNTYISENQFFKEIRKAIVQRYELPHEDIQFKFSENKILFSKEKPTWQIQ